MMIILTILIIVAFAALLYSILQLVLFIRLRRRLKNANRSLFLKLLGDQYKYKPIDENTQKYKWAKGVFIVRASFDKDGKPVGTNSISTRRFFKKRHDTFFN